MKKLTLAIIFCVTAVVAQSREMTNPITISSSSDGFLYLKFSKVMYGGVIEVKDEQDSLVYRVPVDQKRILLDFYKLQPGKYHFTFVKDDVKMSFTYMLMDNKRGLVNKDESIASVDDASQH